jgi:hypothetical protein
MVERPQSDSHTQEPGIWRHIKRLSGDSGKDFSRGSMSVTPARKLAIAQRRQQVAKLYLQGKGQGEIAHELNLTQATISRDLEHVSTAWRESSIRDFDAQRDLEIARLNQIEKEAWAAWERSQQPAQTAVVSGAAGSQTAKRTLRHQCGNPRFLELALRCNEERRKLLGLDAPLKIAPTTPDGRPLTIEQRRTHIFAILREQLGTESIVALEGAIHGRQGNLEALGEHDRPGAITIEPARDDQEPFPASQAGRLS